jgi:large subunit ribosomal protein L18
MSRNLRNLSSREKRHLKIRKQVFGSSQRPRLCVFRSLKHLEAQLIDDIEQKTLLSATTNEKSFRKKHSKDNKVTKAKALGLVLAEKAKKKGISRIVFDRAGYQFHGRVKALANAVLESGIGFKAKD